MENIIKLYPLPTAEIPLNGAYLAHNLREYGNTSGKPYVYANFIASLDGRIAIPHLSGRGFKVPEETSNERDWRLFQEVAAQADIIISSGRYLREWAEGRGQEILRVDDPGFADLREWRVSRGLPVQPDIAIISGSLDFPIPSVLTAEGRKVVVFTTDNPDPGRVKAIETQAGQVIVAGGKSVNGAILVQRLAEMGYRTIYSSAGPKILHLLASAGMLDRLYLTFANRLLGGQPFSSVLEGSLLEPPVAMRFHAVYLDPYALEGAGQLFVSYDRA